MLFTSLNVTHTARLAALLLVASTLPALAQSSAEPAKKTATAADKAAAKPVAKPLAKNTEKATEKAVARSAAKKDAAEQASAKAAAKSTAASSRTNLKSAAVNVAAGISAAEAALTPAELAIAEKIYVGTIPCELGASVTLVADAKTPGFFTLQGKDFRYRMSPVSTSTGAVRLEDPKAGAVWIQLGNKSMLMNQKLGMRMADECMSPQQLALAETLKKNPQASLFDPLPKKPALEEAKPPGVISVFPAPVTN